MTAEQFDAWAYSRVRAFFDDDLTHTPEEQPGLMRVKAFIQSLENDRAVLVRA